MVLLSLEILLVGLLESIFECILDRYPLQFEHEKIPPKRDVIFLVIQAVFQDRGFVRAEPE